MAVLICGSLAYDTIMTFEGRFAEQILPEQLHIMNVSFLVPSLRRDFGGCAGNIAYAHKLLGGDPLPMAALGRDGADYVERLGVLGIDARHIAQVDDTYTAQAMIMTDRDNNQITAFHPGAMMQAHVNKITADLGAAVGIIAPDGRDAMLQHAEQFVAAGIPFVFDPGQGLPMFNGEELRHFIELADWVTVNDYEGKMLCERTGWSAAEISQRVRGLVITLGGEGCEVWEKGEKQHVAPVKAREVVDPTGCGDAWRGALLFGLERNWTLAKCAELGNRLGALKIAQRGPQNYTLDFTVEA
ncbi:carbohydrate kinase family protein [Diaphorobacter ruginosibacter]|jgi:adenosine kinase|uniref:Carbohydrate kinase family protein n=1 Tax=Diaphorobacter ruginosibacter TaxID=1715720 RepID=A0A7G9RM60_9BURK|nr:carbohydrate kinase family protein [Diaphorobacter ruginosibacter]MDR2335718.1 carbohydrate kinase family protein [Burkholderiaceae bacterium]QNN56685.1 carbohydrate kinase family protein [Diaphorobacter ruginosibacter]